MLNGRGREWVFACGDQGVKVPRKKMMDNEKRMEELRGVCSAAGFEMGNLALLDRALTHASLVTEAKGEVEDYEALEFIGDAVLGLAVARYLYEHVPDRTPGEYSRLRAGLVNRRCLARIAEKLGIAGAIRLGRGEELSGGRRRMSLLADCLEALIGAVYLDRGEEAARGFVARIIEPEFKRGQASNEIWDYKSRLQNYCQARGMALPVFAVIRAEGPDHRKVFEIEVSLRGKPVGRGKGSTKKEAEQNAARVALERERELAQAG